jgi:hypothetical protein
MEKPTTDTSPQAGVLPAETINLDLDNDADAEGEAGAEDGAEETGEVEAEAAAEQTPQEPAWLTEFNETGDLNLIPGKAGKSVRKLMSQMGLARDAYYARMESQQDKSGPDTIRDAKDDGDKIPPVDRSSEEAYDASQDARQEWRARKAAEALRAEMSGIKEQANGHIEKMRMQADDQRRTAWIQSQKDCTPEVVEALKDIGGYDIPWEDKTPEQQYWAQQYWNDIGLKNLYKEAVSRVGGKTRTAEETRRRAQIPASVTPRPNGAGTARNTTPSRRFEGKSVNEVIDILAAEMSSGSG